MIAASGMSPGFELFLIALINWKIILAILAVAAAVAAVYVFLLVKDRRAEKERREAGFDDGE